MKKRFNILTVISACLIFSTLPGCGCGTASTTESIETMESTIETESVSQEETSQVPETIEEESVIETEPVETEETMEPTESVSEEIAITEMNETMYAVTNVNIRSEASTDSDKLGALSTGESILVIGVTADELWYRVEEGETIGFVSSAYLSLEKPVIEQAVPAETVPVDSLTETQQKVVDQINQGQQQTGGTPVDNGGSAEADALLGGPPTAATNNRVVGGNLDISGAGTGELHAE